MKVDRMFALVSEQGTACGETALCENCVKQESNKDYARDQVADHGNNDIDADAEFEDCSDNEELRCCVCDANLIADFEEPTEDDYITYDHIHWWQYGKQLDLVTADPDDKNTCADDWKEQVKAHMDDNKFWPNAWFISDHGNAHLLSLSD